MSPATTGSAFDPTKGEAFAGRVLTVLNNGALCLMLSVGHRTGLFDVLSTLPPAKSEEISARAGLRERYVREWLGAMVTAGVAAVDPATTRFALPAEHAAVLTRAVAADNLAVFAQYIALLGCVEDDVVACFSQGGGVPYERYPRFQAVMAEESGQSVLSSLESHVLPLGPGLTDRLAGGGERRLADLGRHSLSQCHRGRAVPGPVGRSAGERAGGAGWRRPRRDGLARRHGTTPGRLASGRCPHARTHRHGRAGRGSQWPAVARGSDDATVTPGAAVSERRAAGGCHAHGPWSHRRLARDAGVPKKIGGQP